MAQREYPYDEGDVTVLGPEIFTDKEGAISHKGENYYTLERAADLMAEAECAAHGHTWEIIEEVGQPGPSEIVCTRCTAARRVLSYDDSRMLTTYRAAALDLIEACHESGYPIVPTPVANAIKRVCDLARQR